MKNKTIDKQLIKKFEKLQELCEPRNQQVSILRDAAMEETEAGIFIPEDGQEDQVSGVVIQCSEDCDSIIPTGTRVYLDRFGCRVLNIGKQEIIFAPEENILALLFTDDFVSEGQS